MFDKPITIELPFNYVKGYSDDGHDDSDIEWKYMVLKLDENKNLTPIQLEPKVGKGKASIQVTEFSGYKTILNVLFVTHFILKKKIYFTVPFLKYLH